MISKPNKLKYLLFQLEAFIIIISAESLLTNSASSVSHPLQWVGWSLVLTLSLITPISVTIYFAYKYYLNPTTGLFHKLPIATSLTQITIAVLCWFILRYLGMVEYLVIFYYSSLQVILLGFLVGISIIIALIVEKAYSSPWGSTLIGFFRTAGRVWFITLAIVSLISILYLAPKIFPSVKPYYAVLHELRPCPLMLDQDKRDECYYDTALLKESPSTCAQIRNGRKKDDCYYFIAMDQGPRICENISNENVQDDCYWSIATDRRDTSICSGIRNQDYREECYSETPI